MIFLMVCSGMHLQLPFWREKKERTPWKAPRAQRRKRSRGRFWLCWVFFTPAIAGNGVAANSYGSEFLLNVPHLSLASASQIKIPCFWPNVLAAGSQNQNRKQRLLVQLVLSWDVSGRLGDLLCRDHHCSGWSCGVRVAIRACRMQMPALLGHNTQYAPMIINVLDRRWSKILAQAQCSDHKRSRSHLQNHGA